MTKSEKRALVEECRKSGMTAKPTRWADITSITKKTPERETPEVKLICGKWTITVEPGFSPGLLAKVIKVVDTVC